MLSRLAMLAAALADPRRGTPSTAQAQDFPTRPIRMVIAFPAGGPTDFVGRLLADKLKESLPQPVLIENKPGANGAIGADFVAKAEPDGHTIFLSTVGAIAITPHMRDNLPYNTLRDFAPVTLVVRNTTVAVVRADHPAKTAQEFVAIAKQKNGSLPFASTGVGSTTHLATEMWATAAGFKFVHVPYRGAAPALTDILGGQVEGILRRRAGADAADRGRQGPAARRRLQRTQPDAAQRARRSPSWATRTPPRATGTACWRRPRLRRRSIAKLNAAFVAAINDPVVKDKLIKSGAVPVANTPAEFGKFLKEEFERWGKVVRERGHQGAELARLPRI